MSYLFPVVSIYQVQEWIQEALLLWGQERELIRKMSILILAFIYIYIYLPAPNVGTKLLAFKLGFHSVAPGFKDNFENDLLASSLILLNQRKEIFLNFSAKKISAFQASLGG